MVSEGVIRALWLHALVICNALLLCSAESSTRFTSKNLPTYESSVFVRDSKPGNFMPSVGNGFLGTVVFSDTVHISGLFGGKAYSKKHPVYPVYLYQHTHRARIPSTAAIEFTANTVGNVSYALEVADGVFYKWFESDELFVEQRVYAHRSRKNVLVVEIMANNSGNKEHLLDIKVNSGNYSKDIRFLEYPVNGTMHAQAAIGEIKVTEEHHSIRARVSVLYTDIPKVLPVPANSTNTWYFITTVATSLDTKFEPLSEATSQWKQAHRDREQLLSEHKAAWRELWRRGKIDIEGNLELARSVHASLYYILSSTRHDWPYGLSPGGLPGGEEYMGHTFWDQDIWMYPPLVLLHPDLARAALRYRFDRLPAARRIARQYGYKGAMFPWESSFTGLETSPGEKYGKHQNHITGDVAFAAKQYWMVTKDFHWLRQIGFPLASQTAEYWASRVEYSDTKLKYVINHVMPPDEYHYPVNNSVYTNVVAKLNLEFAVEAARLLGKSVPKQWNVIAEEMYIPFDEEENYHPAYDGYHLGIQIKQADTILINFPLMFNMSNQVRKNDLRLYEERTNSGGPAMTHAMTAIGWLDVGEPEKAHKAFYKNYDNIEGPFKVWAEKKYGWGAVNFITGAGGFLQTLIYGYGGFRLGMSELKFNPTLPPSTTKLTIDGVNYLGSDLRFEIQDDQVEITLVSSAPIAPDLKVVEQDGATYHLRLGTRIMVPRAQGFIRIK